MKVSILTQPLGRNYGGLLQAYALQVYLKRIGCEVETLDRRRSVSDYYRFQAQIRRLAKLVLTKLRLLPESRKYGLIFQNLAEFRDYSIIMSPEISSERALRRYYKKRHFDVVLVGSDQVWRPKFSPSLYNYYLDFLDHVGSNPKRVSYAASFGVDDWEYSDVQTQVCKELIGKFDAISVREKSGVALCDRYLDVTAEFVLDPTMLLDQKDYEYIILLSDDDVNYGQFITYLLDIDPKKLEIVEKVERILGRQLKNLMSSVIDTESKITSSKVEKYPKVSTWLNSFKKSEFVITDSFHGCVFCIIYNKPFIAIGNSARGLSRFISLLSLFGLEDRLVSDASEIDSALINRTIDWDAVNLVRKEKTDAAHHFLKKAIFQ